MRGTRVHLLGTARVVVDGRTFIGMKATMRDQALAYLACAGGWVTRDRLGFLFWPDTPDRVARHNVRQLLKRIRRLGWLEDLEVAEDALRWPVPTDVDDLRAAVAARRWDDIPAAAVLLPGLERNATAEFEEWLLDERRQVQDAWRSALLKAATTDADAGAPERGARRLEPLLADDEGDLVLPAYMRLAARAGDRAAALAAFERVAGRLRDDLGVDPPRQARELAARLRSAEPERVRFAPGLVVGRRDEIAEIAGLLAQPACRMLTLLGPGGIGKSTLARMLLSRIADRYAEGAVLVSLEPITDPSAIPWRIAAELGAGLDARLDLVAQLTDVLRDRQLLLVLDNAEHLPAGWDLFPRLLSGCPQLVMLVTSRERLQLDEEWVYEVGGLTEEDGVELFRQRGRRVAPGAAATRDDALAVCHAVGGSPLGIELAAPWLRVMSGAEIAHQVSGDSRLLSGDMRSGSSRHRSVDAAMAHSWALASAEERAAIEALSVFAAPYSRQLAADVAGVSPFLLRALVDKSLVQRRPGDRYASHPLVRQYAAARLAADDDRRRKVRARHAQAVFGMLEPPGAARSHPDLLDDAVVAWRYAVDQADLALMRGAVEGLVELLDAGGRYRHGLELFERAASVLVDGACGGAEPATTAVLRYGQAWMLERLGRHADAVDKAGRAVAAAEAAGERRLLVRSLLALAWARKTVDGDRAQYAVTRRALPVAESLDDDRLVVQVRNGLGCSAPTLEECREHLREGLAVTAGANLPDLAARLSGNLGMVVACLGDPRGAKRHLAGALTFARSTAWLFGLVEFLSDLAFLHAELGELDTAQGLSAEAEDLLSSAESVDQKIYATLVAGEIHRLLGDPAGAETRMRDAMRLARAVGNQSLLLRSLRLHGRLLIDAGRLDGGLRVLAVVLAGPTRQGDFTSELLNPRIWAEHTASIAPERVRLAQAWAREHGITDTVAEVLAQTEDRHQFAT